MRPLIQIYALAVCFTTMMCFVVALGVALYDMVQIIAPSFTLQYYQPYESNDAFLQYYPDKKERPGHEITQLREQGLTTALQGERRTALQSVVFMLLLSRSTLPCLLCIGASPSIQRVISQRPPRTLRYIKAGT